MKIKTNIIMAALTSFLCLLPLVLSLVVYNDLPEQVAMQWNLSGNPNWYAHKAVAAFGMPVFFFVLNVFVALYMNNDPKRENTSKTLRAISDWILPVLSIIVVPIILFTAMGAEIPIPVIVLVLVGIILIICGNYMPKSRQNYSIGIKISWTLNDPENWNKTHRMAGFLWVICGISLIVITFLPLAAAVKQILLLIIIALLVAAPVLYSYLLYLKKKRGEESP